jgi:dienelactone hydrolase
MVQVVSHKIQYFHGKEKLIGFVAYPEGAKNLPGMLIVHDWAGLNELYQNRAIELAKQGFVAFSVDMYGFGRFGETNEEKQALMGTIINDRASLRQRMHLGLEELKKIKSVDAERIGAIGFCFGGLCVLDLARMGANIKGVASFHGILKDAPECVTEAIKAQILILHGYDDPMVSPQDVIAFCEEMKKHQAQFQVNMYSNTMHAFTNPSANDSSLGTVYQPQTAKKSFEAMRAFFQGIL